MNSAGNTAKVTVTQPTNTAKNDFMDFSNVPQQKPTNLTVQPTSSGGGLSPNGGSPNTQPTTKTTTASNSLFGNSSNSLFGGAVPSNQNLATQPKDPKAAVPSNNPFKK